MFFFFSLCESLTKHYWHANKIDVYNNEINQSHYCQCTYIQQVPGQQGMITKKRLLCCRMWSLLTPIRIHIYLLYYLEYLEINLGIYTVFQYISTRGEATITIQYCMVSNQGHCLNISMIKPLDLEIISSLTNKQ